MRAIIPKRYYRCWKSQGMSGMLKRLMDKLNRRKMQALIDILPVWYNTCRRVSEICGDALHDVELVDGDIGAVLDKADRMLFQFRNDAGDVRRSIQLLDRQLAGRVDATTRRVFELRNATAKFLIRAQGPSPFARQGMESDMSQRYYHRALEEAGFEARRLKNELDKEIELLWDELDKLIRLTEMRLRS